MNIQYSAVAKVEGHATVGPGISVGDVRADMSYLGKVSGTPVHYAMTPPIGEEWEQASYDKHRMLVRDGRLTEPPRLDTEGFALIEDAPIAVVHHDRDAVKQLYYPAIGALVRDAVGANEAYVFDHLVRRRESDRRTLSFGRTESGVTATNGRIHNDYTEASGQRRLDLVMERFGKTIRGSRFAILNAWRSISGPVLDTPLAVCDSRTVAPADLVTAEVRYPGRIGEIYLVRHSDAHRWFYFSEMDNSDVLLFKQYDSMGEGVPRFTPHAAFDHPRSPPDAPLRQSIEVRCLVVFD